MDLVLWTVGQCRVEGTGLWPSVRKVKKTKSILYIKPLLLWETRHILLPKNIG